MGYVDKNLISGETILYSADIHWVIFLMDFISLLYGLYLFSSLGLIAQSIGIILIIISLIGLLNDTIVKLTSEFSITSRRVIVKVGFIRRVTSELNHTEVESLTFKQGILGRILDYGTIFINGTGGHITRVPNISSPLEFRSNAMQIVDSFHQQHD